MSKEEKKNKSPKKSKKSKKINLELGINLLPKKSDEQIQTEETRDKVNVGSAYSILILVVIAGAIIGVSIYARLQLDSKKVDLAELETKIEGRSSLISSNNELLARVDLYEDIKESTYSTKNILDYWNTVVADYGFYDKIELSSELGFTVTGETDSLTDVSKLWYLLGNDPKIKSVNLNSVSKSEGVVRFDFEGELNFDEFIET